MKIRIWLAKTFVAAVLAVLDSWLTGALTAERAASWRRILEDATIGRAVRLDRTSWWKKKKSDNAFATYMTVLLKSNRLAEYEAKNIN